MRMDHANAGSTDAANCLRILTPLLKFRACRDNIPVATGAMEVRGGNGYIEEWVNARLVRDAHIGVLWEGTSNINALDIITRAVGKSRAHKSLAGGADKVAGRSDGDPGGVPRPARQTLDRALEFAERVAAEPALEADARRAASGLYHVTSAVLMAGKPPARAPTRGARSRAAGAGASPGRAGSAGAANPRMGTRGGGDVVVGAQCCDWRDRRTAGLDGYSASYSGMTSGNSSATLRANKAKMSGEDKRASRPGRIRRHG